MSIAARELHVDLDIYAQFERETEQDVLNALSAITGMFACLLPARRVTRVDPLTALRNQ